MRALLVLCVVVAGGPALGEDKLRVAALAVRAEAGVSQGVANLLGEVIAADVGRSPKHTLISASDVSTLLSVERQKQLMGCAEDTNCLVEISNALGAELVLDISVGTIGNLRVLALRLVDTRPGRPTRRESETVTGEDELVAAAHRLAAKLFELPRRDRGRAVPGVALLGGAGALAVGGVVLGVMANADYQSFRADPFNDPLGDTAKTKAYVADGLYLGAIVAAGVGAVLLLTNTEPGGAP